MYCNRKGKKQIIFPGDKFPSIITDSLCSLVSELYVTKTYFLADLRYKQHTFGNKYNYSNLVKKETLQNSNQHL